MRGWFIVGMLLMIVISASSNAQAKFRLGQQASSNTFKIRVDKLERSYGLHIPPRRSDGAPLLIVLHGTFGTGERMERGLGFDPLADEHGFIIAYPDAYTPQGERQSWRWNDGRGTLRSSNPGIDDVRFLAALIEDVAQRQKIDRRRVFLTGASNGGIMAYRAACERPELFAGVAPVIGNLATPIAPSCRPRTPVSILAINGIADRFVPYAGGEVCAGVPSRLCEGGPVLSAAQSVGRFAETARCGNVPIITRRPVGVDDGTRVEDRRYQACVRGYEVSLVAIHGGGHAWPPRDSQMGQARAGVSSQNLDATKEVVAFMGRVGEAW